MKNNLITALFVSAQLLAAGFLDAAEPSTNGVSAPELTASAGNEIMDAATAPRRGSRPSYTNLQSTGY